MSQPPYDPETRSEGAERLPLPYELLPHEPLPPPILPPGLDTPNVTGAPSRAAGDAPTAPLSPGVAPPAPERQRRKRRLWALLIPLLLLALFLVLCPCAFLFVIQRNAQSSPTTTVATGTTSSTGQNSGPGAGRSPVSSGGPTGTSGPSGQRSPLAGGPTLTPGGASATATLGATAGPNPTATPVPAPTATPVPGQLSVSAVSVQQTCVLIGPLPSFSITLFNDTSGPVSFQTSVVTDMPGTGTPWASATPASGSVPAGRNQQVVVTPNSGLCTDQLLQGTKPFVLTISAVSGAQGTFTITDSVTGLI